MEFFHKNEVLPDYAKMFIQSVCLCGVVVMVTALCSAAANMKCLYWCGEEYTGLAQRTRETNSVSKKLIMIVHSEIFEIIWGRVYCERHIDAHDHNSNMLSEIQIAHRPSGFVCFLGKLYLKSGLKFKKILNVQIYIKVIFEIKVI